MAHLCAISVYCDIGRLVRKEDSFNTVSARNKALVKHNRELAQISLIHIVII